MSDDISVVLLFTLVPPAPYVTLIKSGFNSLNSFKALYILFIGDVFLVGKSSKEKSNFF